MQITKTFLTPFLNNNYGTNTQRKVANITLPNSISRDTVSFQGLFSKSAHNLLVSPKNVKTKLKRQNDVNNEPIYSRKDIKKVLEAHKFLGDNIAVMVYQEYPKENLMEIIDLSNPRPTFFRAIMQSMDNKGITDGNGHCIESLIKEPQDAINLLKAAEINEFETIELIKETTEYELDGKTYKKLAHTPEEIYNIIKANSEKE